MSGARAAVATWSLMSRRQVDFPLQQSPTSPHPLPWLFPGSAGGASFHGDPSGWTLACGCFMMNDDMRILVVEDDKKIASFVVNGLKQSGYAVDHCLDGEDALVMAETTSYDAAVVDLMLPKLDGLSLVQ